MRVLWIVCTCAGLLLGAASCREEGTAEKAGRAIDDAIERLRHGDEGALEKIGRELDEQLSEAAKAAGETAKRAAETVDETAEDVRKAITDAIEADEEG